MKVGCIKIRRGGPKKCPNHELWLFYIRLIIILYSHVRTFEIGETETSAYYTNQCSVIDTEASVVNLNLEPNHRQILPSYIIHT